MSDQIFAAARGRDDARGFGLATSAEWCSWRVSKSGRGIPDRPREMGKKGGKKGGGGDDAKGAKASKCPPGVDPEYFAMTTVRYPATRESDESARIRRFPPLNPARPAPPTSPTPLSSSPPPLRTSPCL